MKNDETGTGRGRGAVPQNQPVASRSPRRRGRRWLWIALGMVVVLGIAGVMGARPAWRMVKRYRAEGFAKEAEAFIRQEQWAQAFQRVRSALQLAPNQPRILRLAAQLYGGAGSEMAYGYFDALLQSGEATARDREEYAALALRLGNQALAVGQIQQLLTAPQPSARAFLLAAQLQAGRRSFTNAVRYAREAVKLDPGNATNSLALAGFLGATKQPADLEEARGLLWPIGRASGPLQLAALSQIANAAEAPRGDREEVVAVLEAKSPRSLPEDLLLFETRVSLDPSRRAAIADEVIEKFGRGNTQQMEAVALWLNRQQLYARTLELVLPDLAKGSSRLYQSRYEALMGLEDFRGAYDFLAQDIVSKDPLQMELLRCRTALRMKDAAAVDSHFKNLLDLASREPRSLRVVADFALRNGRRDIANEAAQKLSRSPQDAIQAYATLLRIADAQGETWLARDYSRKLLAMTEKKAAGGGGGTSGGSAANSPRGSAALQFQIAYYDLLLNENLDAALAVAEAAHKAAPNDYSRRAVLGLAYLRKGEAKKAVDLVDSQIVTWSALPPGIRALTVAIMGANNRPEAAGKLLPVTPLARLKPEERELVRPYLGEGAPAVDEDSLLSTEPLDKFEGGLF